MPCMDIREARLHRGGPPLLSQGQDHAPAPQAVLHFWGRALADRLSTGARCSMDYAVPPTVILSMRRLGWPTPTGTP